MLTARYECRRSVFIVGQCHIQPPAKCEIPDSSRAPHRLGRNSALHLSCGLCHGLVSRPSVRLLLTPNSRPTQSPPSKSKSFIHVASSAFSSFASGWPSFLCFFFLFTWSWIPTKQTIYVGGDPCFSEGMS